MNIMPLGDHLCSHQQVDLAGMKLVQYALEVMAGTDSVTIQASDAGPGKCGVQALLHLLRSCPQEVNVFAVTGWATFRYSLLVAAIVAFHAIAGLVEGQGNTA